MFENFNKLLKEVETKKKEQQGIWRTDNNVIKTASGVRRINGNSNKQK